MTRVQLEITRYRARQAVAAHRRGAHDGEPQIETCRVCRAGLVLDRADPLTQAKAAEESEAEKRLAWGDR